MHGSNHCRLGDAPNEAFIDCRGCCDTQRMPIETSFAKKVTKTENPDDCFLTTLRNDGELDLTLQDVKDRVRSCTL